MALLYGLHPVEYCIGKIISVVCFQVCSEVHQLVAGLHMCLSAIMVSCLASFRSLFVQQRERPRKPTYYFQDTIPNMFLRDRNRAGHSRKSAGMDGVAGCSGLDQHENSEIASDSAITN